ncbi:MAG: MFS transporter [Erythrobacter sp.]|nr:MFS transporter [Erythrobacter sp.]
MDRVFWILCVCGAMISMSFALQIAALPFELANSGVSATFVGVAMGAYALGVIAARLSVGFWLDRVSWRNAIICGSAITAAASFAIAWTDGAPLLFARFALGVGFAVVASSSAGAIGARSDSSQKGKLFGIYYGLNGLALVIAPPLGLVIAQEAGFEPVAYGSAASALLLFLVAPLLSGSGAPGKSGALTFASPHIRLIAAGAFTAVPLGALEATLPFVADAWSISNVVFIYLVWGGGLFVGRVLGGFASDKFGQQGIVLVGLGMALFAQLAIAMLASQAPFLILAAIIGLFLGAGTNGITASLSIRTKPEHQGRMLSWYTLFYYVAFAASSALGGISLQFGTNAPFVLSAACLAIAMVLMAGLQSRETAKVAAS